MSDKDRVQRWRQRMREEGKEPMIIWLSTATKLRLQDVARVRRCAPSELVEQALVQLPTDSPHVPGMVTDTTLLRTLIEETIIQAPGVTAYVTALVTDTVTVTLARELPGLVRQLVEGLALEALGMPVTDTNGSVADLPGGNSIVTEAEVQAPAEPRLPIGANKLTPRQVRELRAKRARKTPIKDLMEEYGISKATVHRYLKQD